MARLRMLCWILAQIEDLLYQFAEEANIEMF